MACCAHGPLYFVSSLFLMLGGAAVVFGFACGLWTDRLDSLWLECNDDAITACKPRDDIKGGVWIGQLTLLCAAVAFIAFAFLIMFFMCCGCVDRRATMFTMKFTFMQLSGACSAASVIWFALNERGRGSKAWSDWDDFASNPEVKYGYYVECAGAGLILLGSIFALLGRCCCDERD